MSTIPVDYCLVGGGAGGGNGGGAIGGGGGAGAVLQGTDALASGSFAVVIGAGGAIASDGVASTFNAHSAAGGGAGSAVVGNNGNPGGCGGGGLGPGGNGGAGSPGYSGGFGNINAGGGGGGAGGGGNNAGINAGVAGGPGTASTLTGISVTYGGGGGGNGTGSAGPGGTGGGGNGGAGGNPGTPGGANTGGGGGGGAGYAGGSGVCVIRYQTSLGTGTGGTITTTGGGAYTVHTFTSNGTFALTVAGSGGGGGGGGSPSGPFSVGFAQLSQLEDLPLPEVTTDRVSDVGTRAALDQFNADNAGYLISIAKALDSIALPKDFAPIWNGSTTAPNFGNSTIAAAYTQIGDLVYFHMQIAFSASTNFGSGTYSFALPFAARAGTGMIGPVLILDSSAPLVYAGVALAASSFQSSVEFVISLHGSTGLVTNTSPFTFATGDKIWVSGTYFAALT